ncbi:hypothetical protein DVA67_011875 [Solirubrobacter sp. CPCC 204708]|uniref:DUF4303 domain-containing protein n=1 Tax=Solirubrobacter deserti TaxID=2282478 RepID=A0ABT4RM98_9ACTN|nr:hypothetical protein [Solirubrobacter deserti]MBE2316676.1 hypothetical protein [Solirubrobacter deserti]MDA0139431.1 hypothetical protein [Solirubrobacter deserti]
MSRAEQLHDVVVERVLAWAADHWPDEPVAALGLAYGAGWAPIPVVGLVTSAEWNEWLAEPDPWGIGLTLWNPGEYSIGEALPVPEQAALIADDLRDAWEMDEDWFAFMGGVARALAAYDWSSLPTSKDFVVFANTSMDINEQHELEAQLKATIPPALLDRFRARRLLDVAPPE